jgi:hypothetical protein
MKKTKPYMKAVFRFVFLFLVALFLIAQFAYAVNTKTNDQRPQRAKKMPDISKREDLFNPEKVSYVKARYNGVERDIRNINDLNNVREGAVLVAKLKAEPELVQLEGERAQIILPYKFQIAGALAGEAIHFRAVAFLENGGLRWNPSAREYQCSVLVGIEDENNPTAEPVDLPEPVDLQFIFSGGEVSPKLCKIGHTSIPYPSIDLTANSEPAAPILTIIAYFVPDGENVEIPVIRPQVELRAPKSIAGFGMGEGDVIVVVPPDLRDTVKQVTLNADPGYIEPIKLIIGSDGTGIAKLRSAGLGIATVDIVDAYIDCDPVEVKYSFPWILLIAVVAGSLVGGALWQSAGGKFPVGFFLGMLTSLAYSCGVNFTKFDFGKFTEVVAFILGASWGASRYGLFKLTERAKRR